MTRKSKANAKCPSNFDLDQGSLGKAFRSRFELDWSEAFFADVEVSSGAAGRERGRSVLPLNIMTGAPAPAASRCSPQSAVPHPAWAVLFKSQFRTVRRQSAQ